MLGRRDRLVEFLIIAALVKGHAAFLVSEEWLGILMGVAVMEQRVRILCVPCRALLDWPAQFSLFKNQLPLSLVCRGLAREGSVGNLYSCCNDSSENCSAMEGNEFLPDGLNNFLPDGLPDGGLPVRCSIPPCRPVTINLPATTTNQLVHGICVNTAQGDLVPIASSSLSHLEYTPVSFTGSPKAWGDRNYVLQGVESVTECNDGVYLRPSLVKSIPSGTEISITVAPWSTTVCVFFKNIDDRDGGWSSNLDETWVTKDYDDFGWDFNGQFLPLMTRCHDINQ
mmetsp:Transcript_29512/g.63564  ORF Transcript_29512/g.63564 Transcript_29512/m.63564 type:complete len:283 (-) Transcript_29512:74-922(-)